MKILGWGTYDVTSHPRVGVLLDGLRAHGHDVRELNRPLGIGTAGRVAALTSPLAAVRFAGRLASRWASLIWGSRLYRGPHAPDAILVGYLGHFDVLLARLLFPRRRIFLDHLIFAADTAADRHVSGGIKNVLLRVLDNAALACADVIILDTPDHRDLVPDRFRPRAVVVPVGAPDVWFDVRETTGRTLTGRIIFYGLFTPLQGAPTIAEALAILNSRGVRCHVTLVGDGQDAATCRDILHGMDSIAVSWESWVDANDLPGLVAAHDICLGIFGTSPKSQRVVPNKAYQGMAAGCALVTSDTPSQRAMLQGALFVPSGDAEALADTLQGLLESPKALAHARKCAAHRADAAFRPYAVTEPLEDALR